MASNLWSLFGSTAIGAAIIGLAAWLVSLGRDKERVEQHTKTEARVKTEKKYLEEVEEKINETLNEIDAISDPYKRNAMYRKWIKAATRASRRRRSPTGN